MTAREEATIGQGSGRGSTTLGRLFVRGAAWKVTTQGGSQALRLATTLTLIHILAPADYGLAAMALVIAGFAVALSDLGLGAAIVQRQQLTDADASTAFWVSAAVGLTLTVATAALADPIAAAYGNARVGPLILALSPIFVIDGLATTQRALLARRVDFRSLELRSLGGTIVGSAVAIPAALHGAGPWALIFQELANAVAATALLWRAADWRPRMIFARQSIRELGDFAWRTLGGRILSDVNDTADNVLVGRFLGSASLGVYAITYTLVFRPTVSLVLPLQEVLFPVISRNQGEADRVAAAWLRVTRLTTSVTLPLLCGLVVVAPEFVHVFFGSSWESADRIVQIMAIVGAVQAVSGLHWSVLSARGEAASFLRFAAVRTTCNVSAFAIGLHWGVTGVAAMYAGSSVLLLVPYTWITARAVGLPTVAFFANLAVPVQTSFVMAGVVLAIRKSVLPHDLAPSARLAILVLCGAATYTATAWLRDGILRREVRELLDAVGGPHPKAGTAS